MQALIDYIGGLILAGGDHDGERFEALGWQRRFLRGAFRLPGDAALSCARGNGKSAFVAAIACAVVDPRGPLTGRRREVVVVASAFGQAKIVYEDVLAMLGERFDLSDRSESGGGRTAANIGDAGVPGHGCEDSVSRVRSESGARHPALIAAAR